MIRGPDGGHPLLYCEGMLGRLATWLRILGYDAPLLTRPPAISPPGAVLLTRRRRLAGRPGVVLVRHDRVEDQLRQVLGELGLRPAPEGWFSRCLACNQPVQAVEAARVAGLVPDYTLATASGFTRCPSCGKIFWPGSHGRRAAQRIERLMASLPAAAP